MNDDELLRIVQSQQVRPNTTFEARAESENGSRVNLRLTVFRYQPGCSVTQSRHDLEIRPMGQLTELSLLIAGKSIGKFQLVLKTPKPHSGKIRLSKTTASGGKNMRGKSTSKDNPQSRSLKRPIASPPKPPGKDIFIRIHWSDPDRKQVPLPSKGNKTYIIWILLAILAALAMLLASGQGHLLEVLLRFWPILP